MDYPLPLAHGCGAHAWGEVSLKGVLYDFQARVSRSAVVASEPLASVRYELHLSLVLFHCPPRTWDVGLAGFDDNAAHRFCSSQTSVLLRSRSLLVWRVLLAQRKWVAEVVVAL